VFVKDVVVVVVLTPIFVFVLPNLWIVNPRDELHAVPTDEWR